VSYNSGFISMILLVKIYTPSLGREDPVARRRVLVRPGSKLS
jgi:hypothetical protein